MEDKGYNRNMDEIEVLGSIYGDCIVAKSENEFAMRFLPFIGDENDKAFLLVDMEFTLPPEYPRSPPSFKVAQQKGLDEESLQAFISRLQKTLSEMAKESDNSPDSSGYLYEAIDYIKTLLTEINDSIGGSCSICLEEFAEGSKEEFSKRDDLCRVSGCYHRFHKICLYNYWFVQLSDEVGEFGVVIKHKLKDEKSCPVCRIKVDLEEAKKLVNAECLFMLLDVCCAIMVQ
eukprot:TRINITY_DN3643_c0_g1_i20.p1 TRINITY_DN3643_c0_g1~~TRINITY_DN3643_c0_g1_i20.p1  ORF type:complete len:231 (-),score=56.79 TRINITY_DN3643_c0_g1_i20:165-857(-)